ncbi:DUF1254 domain-containing protein [Cryobacterium arcticum]|uniref:DUF1254 domain-containing protein n=1 Tax=Cryobacterium arcticum TaxID=670052 RepID=A0A317ZQY4_9MICO|nr:DUF1214 domain-containing protein [Cryobacterium arcticum]PXA67155.1 DUF1254 domain-containing protein [Cryobacterium arcticum]
MPTQLATKTPVPPEVTTASQVETGIGALEFTDGFPAGDTAAKVRDHLDYLHGVDTFMNTVQGVSTFAIRKGFLEAGVQDGEVLIFSALMDSRSLFLTGNADTVYFWVFVDLADGPMVLKTPSDTLGVIDDMWFRWIADFGLPGADRGRGGSYLLVPPGYDGPLPEGGFYVHESRTNLAFVVGRAFINEYPGNDPAPAASRIKEQLKIYPYAAGGIGSSVGSYLTGEGPLGQVNDPRSPRFVEGTGLAMNTIPPVDFGHFEMVDQLVQREPATALDAELAGSLAAIGIVKDETFAPDARRRSILDAAAAFANAASRTVGMGAHPIDDFRYYDDAQSAWWNMLFDGGFEFLNPPPLVTSEGIKPFPNKGARRLHSRTSFFYTATCVTPAMCMRLTNVGSQYLLANVDRHGAAFDGARTYRVTLPKDIPAARFWSLNAYDNQTRSLLQTDQIYPRAGSQAFPSPATEAEPDGSTVVYLSPTQPDGIPRSNWIQTDPNRGWFVILRLYSPLQPFFDMTWRPSEFEPVP